MKSPFEFEQKLLKENLAERPEAQKRLTNNLINKTNTVIVSPRKWGKTTLLRRVIENLSSYSFYRFSFIDLFKIRSEEDFFKEYLYQVINVLSDNVEEGKEYVKKFQESVKVSSISGYNGQSKLNLDIDFSKIDLENILNIANEIAEQKKLTLYVCLDSFQNITMFDDIEGFQRKLSVYGKNHRNVVYIFSGNNRKLMNQIFQANKSPLYKFGELFYLSKLKTEEFSNYLMRTFSTTHKTISKSLAEELVEIMENHPFYVNQLADLVWKKTDSAVCISSIEKSSKELIERNQLLFQKEFSGLSKIQLNFLKAMVDGVKDKFTSKQVIQQYHLNSSASTLRAIEGLEKKEVLEKINKKFQFVDPAFKLWLKGEVWTD